jgi:hypothetical protein
MAALHFAELGDPDAALAALERSIAAHEAGFELIGFNPAFNVIRDTPRFRALIEKMGLSAYHAKYRKPPGDLQRASRSRDAARRSRSR